EEPTFTTMRRKSPSAGGLRDMPCPVPATIGRCAHCLACSGNGKIGRERDLRNGGFPDFAPRSGATARSPGDLDRHFRLALRFLARSVLSQGAPCQGSSALLCRAFFHDRAHLRVLPQADRG